MKTYIMRWNPGISSSKIKDYNAARKKWPNGFQGNWSIYEWENARHGDIYFMVRVGEGPNGIVYHGKFLSDPYTADDWAGTNKLRHYVDITIEDAVDPDHPMLTIDQLKECLPEITWDHGHSGELLTYEQAEKLLNLIDRID